MRRAAVAVLDWLVVFLTWSLIGLVITLLLTRDVYVAADISQKVRLHVRDIEFDFVGWTFDALGVKFSQNGAAEQLFLREPTRSQVVVDYFKLRARLEEVEAQVARLYADPAVADPLAASSSLRASQASLRAKMLQTQALTESILQEQLSVILAEQGLTTAGQPIPPVAFHLTALPFALIVSPREVIRQDVNLDVSGDLTLDQLVAIEGDVSNSLKVSALAVPLGGIGTYPTMVGQSSDLNWLASVIAHEWTHNYLTLRPLGVNYGASAALRTMNETTAEMTGIELGTLLMQRYYPELAPPPQPYPSSLRRDKTRATGQAPDFDFRAEMHDTRVTVDALLAQDQIDEAEAYMEARRRILWDHGYQIRKLNQAYFAFYGAYGSGGGGAAGTDPVGDAVRLLRRRSPSIAKFVNTMATFTKFEQLESYLGARPPG